jgi:hypothetical protein
MKLVENLALYDCYESRDGYGFEVRNLVIKNINDRKPQDNIAFTYIVPLTTLLYISNKYQTRYLTVIFNDQAEDLVYVLPLDLENREIIDFVNCEDIDTENIISLIEDLSWISNESTSFFVVDTDTFAQLKEPFEDLRTIIYTMYTHYRMDLAIFHHIGDKLLEEDKITELWHLSSKVKEIADLASNLRRRVPNEEF